MKKIFSYAAMLLAGLFVFTSCESDRDSNPTLTQPTTFVLNNPAVGEGCVDLNLSSGIDLTWSAPTPYTTGNAPVVVTYTIQASSTGTFNKAYSEAEDADNTGADFYQFDETTTLCNKLVDIAELGKSLQKLNHFAEGDEIPQQKVYFRIKAAVQDGAAKEYYPVLSNVVSINAQPYYVELKDAEVEMWCILGGAIGNGKWTNSEDGLGVANFPLFCVDAYPYDKKTGQGEIEIVNYFETSQGFKCLPRSTYSWDYGLCAGADGAGTAMYRNAGDDNGDIKPAADGYYRFVIDTKAQTAKFEAYEVTGTPTAYAVMSMTGFNGDWNTDVDMTPVFTSANNHVWYGKVTVENNTEFKFRADHDWAANWGATSFPTGIGTGNGNNIQMTAGSWDIMFNDLTGAYSCTAAK